MIRTVKLSLIGILILGGVLAILPGATGQQTDSDVVCRDSKKSNLKATHQEFSEKLRALEARAKADREEYQKKKNEIKEEKKRLRKEREDRFKQIRNSKC